MVKMSFVVRVRVFVFRVTLRIEQKRTTNRIDQTQLYNRELLSHSLSLFWTGLRYMLYGIIYHQWYEHTPIPTCNVVVVHDGGPAPDSHACRIGYFTGIPLRCGYRYEVKVVVGGWISWQCGNLLLWLLPGTRYIYTHT